MRFEKWHKCDAQAGYNRDRFDRTKEKLGDPSNVYPCFREYYEASYACSDDLFDFLLELHYIRKANHFDFSKISNLEMRRIPTVYDSPLENDRRTYTY